MVVAEANDFTDNALADFGVTITRYPVTKTILSNGDEVLTLGISGTFTGIIHLKPSEYKNEKSGEVITLNGYVMTGPSTTINKDDIILYDNIKYIIHSVRARGPAGSVAVYKYCEIKLYEQ